MKVCRSLRSHLDRTIRHCISAWDRKKPFGCSDNDRNGETANDCKEEFVSVNLSGRNRRMLDHPFDSVSMLVTSEVFTDSADSDERRKER